MKSMFKEPVEVHESVSVGEHEIVPLHSDTDIGKCVKCGEVEPPFEYCEAE